MTKRVRLLVGTKKGAFILDSDAVAPRLVDQRPAVRGLARPRPHRRTRDGRDPGRRRATPWYGPAVWRSDDGGTTWSHSSNGMTYGDEAEPIKTIWSLASAPDGSLLAGVEPAGLFRSTDRGATWTHVEGLTNHPTPADLGAGRRRAHPPHDHPAPDRHRPDVGRDLGRRRVRDARRRRVMGAAQRRRPRRVQPRGPLPGHRPVRPQVRDGGRPARDALPAEPQRRLPLRRWPETWQEITDGLPTDFGFAMVSHPRDPDTCWVIPLSLPEQGRYMPDGHTRGVADARPRRVRGSARTRACRRETPTCRVLREAMARDTLDPVGITFGTETGQLWHSSDERRVVADDHRHAARDLGGRDGRPRRLSARWRRSCSRASLIALFPGVGKRHEVEGETVGALLVELDRSVPGHARAAGRGRAPAAAAHQRLRRRLARRPRDGRARRGRRPRPARGERRVGRGYAGGAAAAAQPRGPSTAAERDRTAPSARRPSRAASAAPGCRPADRRRSSASRGRPGDRAWRAPPRPSRGRARARRR